MTAQWEGGTLRSQPLSTLLGTWDHLNELEELYQEVQDGA
jgi:hypothetical protein